MIGQRPRGRAKNCLGDTSRFVSVYGRRPKTAKAKTADMSFRNVAQKLTRYHTVGALPVFEILSTKVRPICDGTVIINGHCWIVSICRSTSTCTVTIYIELIEERIPVYIDLASGLHVHGM